MQRKSNSAFGEVLALARQLPVLGGLAVVVAVTTTAIGAGQRLVGELLDNGGDVTAVLNFQLEMMSTATVKAVAWGDWVLTFLGVN